MQNPNQKKFETMLIPKGRHCTIFSLQRLQQTRHERHCIIKRIGRVSNNLATVAQSYMMWNAWWWCLPTTTSWWPCSLSNDPYMLDSNLYMSIMTVLAFSIFLKCTRYLQVSLQMARIGPKMVMRIQHQWIITLMCHWVCQAGCHIYGRGVAELN